MANIDVTELFALANRSRRWASTSISYSLVTSSYTFDSYVPNELFC
jgi:hypothetical protein